MSSEQIVKEYKTEFDEITSSELPKEQKSVLIYQGLLLMAQQIYSLGFHDGIKKSNETLKIQIDVLEQKYQKAIEVVHKYEERIPEMR